MKSVVREVREERCEAQSVYLPKCSKPVREWIQ